MTNIIIYNNESKAQWIVDELKNKNPIFVCVIANTETGKIKGISAAGQFPEVTDYTPPADVEYVLFGKPSCIPFIPVTPEGIPTPAIITKVSLSLANIPMIVVDGGLKVKPAIPFITIGGEPGNDIRTGRAAQNVAEVIKRAQILGQTLSKFSDYLVIGESIAGGTTTALGVLSAMGIDAKNRVSSSMPNNPHDLKIKTVEEGMKSAGINFGDLKDEAVKAIEILGDPMLPALSGTAIGFAEEKPVILAGGTQMAAALAVINSLEPNVLENVAIGTTKWIIQDKTADLKGLVNQIKNIPVLAANLDFSKSRFGGLKAYENGAVKEGVGAGGAAIAAMLKTGIDSAEINKAVEKEYERLMSLK